MDVHIKVKLHRDCNYIKHDNHMESKKSFIIAMLTNNHTHYDKEKRKQGFKEHRRDGRYWLEFSEEEKM